VTSTVLRAPASRPATGAPAWSARACSDSDYDDVLAFFSEPDFFFRTAEPDTRSEWEIRKLVGADTRLLLADDEPAGLYALEGFGGEHGCHYQVHLRLRAAAPNAWWHSAFEEIVRALTWKKELVRLAVQVGEFDGRGLAFARSLGLTEEGTLASVVRHGGQRYGYVFFARIWALTS
jgi:hypothetical protein